MVPMHVYIYVTEHEKTGLMYTKYISLYYGTISFTVWDIKIL